MKTLTEQQKEKLRLVLAHEYRRCDQAFMDFLDNSTELLNGRWSKINSLSTNDCYARFLHHLYEFYVGVFKKNAGSLSNIGPHDLDKLFNAEVEKLLRIRRWRIDSGNVHSNENDFSSYQDQVSESFSTDFRQCRNRVAHTDFRRMGNENSITLPQFYKKYHKYVVLLYEEPYWLWHVKAESLDWREIEAFENIFSEPLSKGRKLPFLSKIGNGVFYKQLKQALALRREQSS